MEKGAKNKSVIIIGSGIAGITAAYYARRCGYDTTILEKHSSPGGMCTSWKRKGYLFEGCIHWLTGSNPDSYFYKAWKEVGAFDENIKVYHTDPFYVSQYKGTEINLYRNLDKFINQLLEISPEDKEAIMTLRKHIEYFMKEKSMRTLENIDGIQYKYPIDEKLAPPDMKLLMELSKETADQYGHNRFKNEAIQKFFRYIFGPDGCIIGAMFTLAILMENDGGYPQGGSIPMVNRMVDKYKSIGGKIQYSSPVEKIITENDEVKGVIVKGKTINADCIIYTGDTIQINQFLDKKITDPEFCDVEKKGIQKIVSFISLGIKTDLSKYPHILYFDCEPLKVATMKTDYLGLNNYSTYDGEYSEKGKSAITVYIRQSTEDYKWWKKAKENGTYQDEKDKLAKGVIDRIAVKIPEIKDNVEVIDVATPLTFEKFTNAYAGSYMNVVACMRPLYHMSSKCKDYKNLYFSGQRLIEPGGLPVALITGRTAVQYLCKDDNKVFINEEP